MPDLPADHPDRLALANEVHARSPSPLTTPARVTHVSVLLAGDARAAEAAHLADLFRSFGLDWPADAGDQVSAQLGAIWFTWERHGEFSGFTCTVSGAGTEPAGASLPAGWLAALPGQTVFAAHASTLAEPAGGVTPELLARHFGSQPVIGAEVASGAAVVLTDFRVHADGYARVLLLDRALTPRQAGRTLQRLFDIEVYRMLALLAFPIARRQLVEVAAIESELAQLTGEISKAAADDETLLGGVTRLAGRVERELASSRFRYGACRAYSGLVFRRIEDLRETRLPGLQTIGEFMERRFTPAVATCATASQRLQDSASHVARAGALLSTRVDIAHEKQNRALLASMNKRAKMQLLLQQAVETLSIAAIAYYAAGLIGYVAKGLKSQGVPLDVDTVVAVAVPFLIVLTIMASHRLRTRAFPGSGDHGEG